MNTTMKKIFKFIILLSLLNLSCKFFNDSNKDDIEELKPIGLINDKIYYAMSLFTQNGNVSLRMIDNSGNSIYMLTTENEILLKNKIELNKSLNLNILDIVDHSGNILIQSGNRLFLFSNNDNLELLDQLKLEDKNPSNYINGIIECENFAFANPNKDLIINNNFVSINQNKIIGPDVYNRIFSFIDKDDHLINMYSDYSTHYIIYKRYVENGNYDLNIAKVNANIDEFIQNPNYKTEDDYLNINIYTYNENNSNLNNLAQGKSENGEMYFINTLNKKGKSYAYYLKFNKKNLLECKIDSTLIENELLTGTEIIYAGENYFLFKKVEGTNCKFYLCDRNNMSIINQFSTNFSSNYDVIVKEIFNRNLDCLKENKRESYIYILVGGIANESSIKVFKYPQCGDKFTDKIQLSNNSNLYKSTDLFISNIYYNFDCNNSLLDNMSLTIENQYESCVESFEVNISIKNYSGEIITSKNITINEKICKGEKIIYDIPEFKNLYIPQSNWCENGNLILDVKEIYKSTKLNE